MGQAGPGGLQSGLQGRVGAGQFEIERLQTVGQNFCHQHASIPFMIGRDDVPGRCCGGGGADGVVIGGLIAAPKAALTQIRRAEFPVLGGIIQPCKQAQALFVQTWCRP